MFSSAKGYQLQLKTPDMSTEAVIHVTNRIIV